MTGEHWAMWIEYLRFDEDLWAEQLWEMTWLLEFMPEYIERLDLKTEWGL